jgi:hypothetical protein
VTAFDAARVERRAAELRHAAGSLRAEWAFWRAQADAALEKHSTQIESVERTLGAALERVGVGEPGDRAERVLDLHHVWDFFRVKFALRYIDPIRSFLDVADELAWAAYGPAMTAAGRSGITLREPPLVFLDRGTVPFAAARGSSYRDLLPRGVRTGAGALAAAELPFPVIGMPWYLSNHVPGALLVAHEVGHHIEDDCGLAPELDARLAASGLRAARQDLWSPWLGEVFADVVGAVTCGVAYVVVLADALAAGSAGGAGAQRYPPPRARLRAAITAVRVTEQPDGGAPLPDGGEFGDADDADDEAPQVVHAILAGSYDGLGRRTLRAVLAHADTAKAAGGAALLLKGLPSGLADVRAVLSAAAIAFRDSPEDYDAFSVGHRALGEVLALRPQGPRGPAVTDPHARAARDVAAGRALLDLLGRG